MEERMLGIFQREVAPQARFALRAAAEIEVTAEQLEGLPMRTGFMEALGEGNDRLWSNAQLLLSAAGNLSKLLWGNKSPEALAERAALRASLGVTDDSPLYARRMRNHVFEHFDTVLIEWAEKWGPDALLFDAMSGAVRRSGGDADSPDPFGHEPGYPEHHLRYYDRARRRLLLGGKPYDLDLVLEAVSQVRDRAEAASPHPI
jgi:hypothetical protein